jgi:hypothetical protein
MLAMLSLGACGMLNPFGPEFGVVEVAVPGGRTLYFRREVRGRNYDALAVSEGPDPCRSAEESQDIVFREQGPLTIYYGFAGNRLRVYSTSPVSLPPRPSLIGMVESHVLGPLEWAQMETSYQKQGLKKLEVPLNVSRFRCL